MTHGGGRDDADHRGLSFPQQDAPLDLLRESTDWKPVVCLIDAWAKEELGPVHGYSSDELDRHARAREIRFPVLLREWWRLAGRHPLVDPGVLQANARFLAPHDPGLFARPHFLAIAVDDDQTWSCNGIHVDFLADADPPIHGINGTIGPDDDPSLDWYKGAFIATRLRVPTLVFTTLLYHFLMPSPSIRDGAVYLAPERFGLRGGQPDERLVSGLRLQRFPNTTIIGDLYSDGADVIYGWLFGCACRTAAAAERVHQLVPARPRPW